MKIGLIVASTLALVAFAGTAFADEEPAVEEAAPKVEETVKTEEAQNAEAPAPLPMPPVEPVVEPVSVPAPTPIAPIRTNVPANADRPAADAPKNVDSQSGVVATLAALRPMQLGSSGNEAERNCASLGSQCTADGASGGGFMFAIGGMWKYVGFDVLGGLSVDGGARSFVDASGAPRSYNVSRAGAFAAARLRGSYQTKHVRFMAAAGPGASVRAVGLSKESFGVPHDGNTYGSLAFTADVGAQWRMTRSTALAAGAMLWVEDAGQDVKTHALLGNGDRHLVSGVQTMLMPYIGLQFGP